jgi:60 kDa SS-A/Ro ribonucleoprotein
VDISRVLPFRFIAAARAVPAWEQMLEPMMLRACEGREKLAGRTLVMLDVSGSMDAPISAKSDMQRIDAACGVAILLRELCESVEVLTFSDKVVQVPARRGFALRDAIVTSQQHSGTYMGRPWRP